MNIKLYWFYLLYLKARYYSSGLSVWLSVDALAGKYPSTSAFMYVRGNPVMLVDPDGDSTLYYNSVGKLLFCSYDNIDNAVVIIPKDKNEEFNLYLKKMKENKTDNSTNHNVALRVMGEIYDIENIRNWYNNELPGEWSNSSIMDGDDYQKIRLEKKAYLINNNGSIEIGSSSNLGGEKSSIPPDNKPTNASGLIHTHYLGSGVKTKPSFQDFQNYNVNYYGYKNPSRVIMVEGMPDESGKGSKIRAIYIFNGHPSQTITIYPKSFRHD